MKALKDTPNRPKTLKEVIQECIDSTSYIGSHRASSFIDELRKQGYIIKKKRG